MKSKGILLLIGCLYLSPLTFAQSNSHKRLSVIVIDSKWGKHLGKYSESQNAQVYKIGQRPRLSDLPPQFEIKKLVKDSGLTHFTKSWDALDLSVYLIAIQNSSVKSISKEYPSIPANVSKKVKVALKKLGYPR